MRRPTMTFSLRPRRYYERDRLVALVDGPYEAQPISFSGLFRTTIKRLDAVRQLPRELRERLLEELVIPDS